MKYNSYIIISFLILFANSAIGQNKSLGIDIGFGLSGFKEPYNAFYLRQTSTIVDYVEPNYKYGFWGFRLGVNKTWELSKRYSFRAGLSYAQEGYKKEFRTIILVNSIPTPNYIKVVKSFNFFKIPLLLQVHPIDESRFFIFGGTTFDLLASAKSSSGFGGGRPIRETQFHHRLGQSLVAGAGYSLNIDNKFDLTFRGQYSQGILNIYKMPFQQMDILLNEFSLLIGLQYSLN